MKKIVKLILLAGTLILIACSEKPSDPGTEYSTVTVPFVARYSGVNHYAGVSPCGSEFHRVIESANGKGTVVGFSTLNMDYCFSVKELKVGYSYIRTSTGDTLFISCWGKTCKGMNIPDTLDTDHPDEICCWNIPFTIIGGTGIFKEVGGGGTTDDYLSNNDNTYYHSWTGTITLPKDVYNKMK